MFKISAKKYTITSEVRKKLGFSGGDTLVYEIIDEGLLVHKVAETKDNYLSAISSTLKEWNSDEDNEAWCDL